MVVTDTLPAELTFVSNVDACTEVSLGVLECNLGSIPVEGTVTFTIIANVNSDASGTARNTATVHSNEQPDPVPTNNTASADIAIESGPIITAQKWYGDDCF